MHALLFALLWLDPSAALLQTRPAPVEDQVYAEMVADPDQRAYVVVLLRSVPAEPRGRLQRQKEAVAEVQERVLAQLEPGDLELRYRYRTFAGLTGRVSAAGLTRLRARR